MLPGGLWNEDDLSDITNQYLTNGGEFLVGVLDNRIVCMGALKKKSDTAGEIKRMRVLPDFQRKGYGQLILDRLETKARKLDFTELYRTIITNHILPCLGNTVLAELKPQAIQKLYSEKMKAGLSNRTIQIINNVLHKGLENAIKTGLLMRNPLVSVECPKIGRREMVTMSEADIHILLEYARSSPYYSLFYTLLFTGMRRSEALALKWSDVDLLMLKISINKSLTYLNKPKDGNRILRKAPKTAKSRRNISITPSNAVVLREYQTNQNEQRSSLGLPLLANGDFVFCGVDGKPYLPNSITHAWIKLARKCGLKGIRLHDARHSHASLLLKQGVHPKVVQERLGHVGIAIILDLYSHVAPGMQEAAALKFDDIVVGTKDKDC